MAALLAAQALAVPALADTPLDPALLDARCLVIADGQSRAKGDKDLRLLMLKGFFAGRIIGRQGAAAGRAAVDQARKDLANPAARPDDATCQAVLDTAMS